MSHFIFILHHCTFFETERKLFGKTASSAIFITTTKAGTIFLRMGCFDSTPPMMLQPRWALPLGRQIIKSICNKNNKFYRICRSQFQQQLVWLNFSLLANNARALFSRICPRLKRVHVHSTATEAAKEYHLKAQMAP